MQAAVPPLLFASEAGSNGEPTSSLLELRGGTDADMAPPVAYLQHVLLPALRRLWGIQIDDKARIICVRQSGLNLCCCRALCWTGAMNVNIAVNAAHDIILLKHTSANGRIVTKTRRCLDTEHTNIVSKQLSGHMTAHETLKC